MFNLAHASLSAPWRLLLMFCVVLLCACGQTGALYLPEDAEQEAEPKHNANH